MEVLKCLWRGKAPGPDGILNEMVMYGGGRLFELMLQVMHLVLRSESCPVDWKRSLGCRFLSRMVTMRKSEIIEGLLS